MKEVDSNTPKKMKRFKMPEEWKEVNMWRPEDLKNPFSPAAITVRNVFGGKPISHYEAFEYGADAMLEALRKDGDYGFQSDGHFVMQNDGEE